MTLTRRPIFLLGSHKSGTSLLRSLLDGQEKLFVIPIEAHFFQYSGYWVDYALRKSRPRTLTFDQLVESFAAHIRRSNQAVSLTSDSVLAGYWDLGRFTAHLQSCGGVRYQQSGIRGFFDAYVEAMYVSLYGSLPTVGKRFVEKSVENAEYAALLKHLYPDAKFVHIIRNPYATVVSIRRHMARSSYPFLGKALAALSNSYYYLYKNSSYLSDYLVIRYEDVVTGPEETIRRVARFLELEFDDVFLKPSVMGKLWRGNSTFGEKFDGISKKPLANWQEDVQPLEIEFVNQIFGHVLRDFGYRRLAKRGYVFLPAAEERLRTYIKNRLLWLLLVRSGMFTI